MPATLRLDRFELMWLAEGAIGRSHLRWDIYSMFVNDVYPQLSDNEREAIYTYIKRDDSRFFEGNYVDETAKEYFYQMLARFNPANQFIVTLKEGRKKQQIVDNAYFWDGKYYVGWNRYCAPEYIKKIVQKPYKKCTNEWCGSCINCERFLTYGDKATFGGTLDGVLSSCEKCDFIIEKEDGK